MRDLKRGLTLAAVAAVATGWGLMALVRFDLTPGPPGTSPLLWPVSSTLKRSATRSQILVFAHPYCPCTTATLAELSRFSADPGVRREPPAITLVAYRPPASDWKADQLVSRAPAGTSLTWDPGAVEARRFGAATSGLVLLYSVAGRLLFRGGVTESRGHEGANYGFDTLLRVYSAPHSVTGLPAVSRVFGCSLGGV